MNEKVNNTSQEVKFDPLSSQEFSSHDQSLPLAKVHSL